MKGSKALKVCVCLSSNQCTIIAFKSVRLDNVSFYRSWWFLEDWLMAKFWTQKFIGQNNFRQQQNNVRGNSGSRPSPRVPQDQSSDQRGHFQTTRSGIKTIKLYSWNRWHSKFKLHFDMWCSLFLSFLLTPTLVAVLGSPMLMRSPSYCLSTWVHSLHYWLPSLFYLSCYMKS